MAGKSKSAKYYASNPEARKKKNAYDQALNSRKEQVQKRVEANRARRKAKAAGKDVRGKDYNHGTKSFVKSSVNRGAKSGTKGDRNARGGGKSKK
jgi:hypothetical protein